jgi:hypothetical protein
MTEKLNIPAIHDDDLKKLLLKFNLLDCFEKGQLTCLFCESIVTYENLYGIQFKDNSLRLICDSTECNEGLMEVDNG